MLVYAGLQQPWLDTPRCHPTVSRQSLWKQRPPKSSGLGSRLSDVACRTVVQHRTTWCNVRGNRAALGRWPMVLLLHPNLRATRSDVTCHGSCYDVAVHLVQDWLISECCIVMLLVMCWGMLGLKPRAPTGLLSCNIVQRYLGVRCAATHGGALVTASAAGVRLLGLGDPLHGPRRFASPLHP